MAERQPSVSWARMESQLGINILHLPLIIHKEVYLETDDKIRRTNRGRFAKIMTHAFLIV